MTDRTRTPGGLLRARALGIPFDGTPGACNAVTDVPGVEVGYTTLIDGDDVRTGVTAVLPRGRAGVATPCASGWYSLNGNGEMTGTAWLDETGSLTLPVAITNTHAIGPVHRGLIDWVVANRPDLAREWLLPVVGETWDGYLNDINGPHVQPANAVAAVDAARSGPIEEGSVGGGTGMNCYAFKGGSGTASRVVEHESDRYTVGVFVQANFGARRELVVAGAPVGHQLLADNPMEEADRFAAPGAGSVIVVVATDAPLLPGQCTALARRVPLGLARTGTTGSHFSGDLFLAFSTANAGALTSTMAAGGPAYEQLRFVPWGRMNPFYEATVQATEEAVLNSLTANADMVGRDGHRTPALPHDRLVELLRDSGVRLDDG
ncbi:P1 family peptidase [Saccharopolyspora sp. WRP15-2]|uniref:P1 family peptidase n=1 Tax=Saccharopolyspora oryzae TaxID=2997343 RepID=A0ABT4V7T9_9PSEU|nr:P1 family peptidase [Saccharopolyspora oryzae]MDA3629342.1 P1 family peptidase [Saccharopolyspora oryzae]